MCPYPVWDVQPNHPRLVLHWPGITPEERNLDLKVLMRLTAGGHGLTNSSPLDIRSLLEGASTWYLSPKGLTASPLFWFVLAHSHLAAHYVLKESTGTLGILLRHLLLIARRCAD